MTETTEQQKSKAWKRLGCALLSLLVLLTVLILALPAIISMKPVSRLIVQAVDQRVEGDVAIDSISLSWLKGQEIRGLSFRQPQGQLAINVESVNVASGLISLRKSTKDLGDVSVDRVHITCTAPAAAAQTGPSGKPAGLESPAPRAGTKKLALGTPPDLQPFKPSFDVVAHLSVTEARIDVLDSPGAEPISSLAVDVDVRCKSLHQAMEISLEARSLLTGTGQDEAKLTLAGEVDLLTDGVLDPGRLDARFDVKAQDFDLRGLSPLAVYVPGMPGLSGRLDSEFNLKMLGPEDFKAKGWVQLETLVIDSPHLGTDKPGLESMRIEMDVLRDRDGVNISKMQLVSPLLSGEVSGKIRNHGDSAFPIGKITIAADLDIAELSRQIPGTLGLRENLELSGGAFSLAGNLDFAADGVMLTAAMGLTGVAGKTQGKEFQFETPVRSELAARLHADGVALEKLTLSSSFADIKGSGNQTAAVIRAGVDLSLLAGELGQIVDIGDVQIGGNLESVVRMRSIGPDQHRIDTELTIEGLFLVGLAKFLKKDAIPDADMGLRGILEVTMMGARMQSINVSLGAESVHMRGGIFKNDPPGLKLIQFDADVGFTGERLDLRGLVLKSDLGEMSAQASIKSSGIDREGTLDIRLSVDQPAALAFMYEAGLVDQAVPLDGTLELVAGARLSGQSLDFERLDLGADAIRLKGKGSLKGLDAEKLLAFQGDLKLDYEKLALVSEALSGYRPNVSGTSEKPFTMRASLADPDWIAVIRSMDASGAVLLPQYEAFGIVVKDLDVRLTVADSRAAILVKTEVNEGTLNVSPYLDVSGEHAFVGVPDASEVMKGVKLTDKMSSQLLGLIHPIFRGCSVLGGEMGMTLDQCRVPLDKAQHGSAKIQGGFQLHQVLLSPGGMLKDVLGLLKLSHSRVEVPDQDIRFECRDGRIYPTPLEISIDKYTLTLTGSVGLDQTVAYIAEVPITEDLVGRNIYPFLKDESLTLRIGGTVQKPDIGRDTFLSAIHDLVKKAGKKAVVNEGLKLLEGFLGQ